MQTTGKNKNKKRIFLLEKVSFLYQGQEALHSIDLAVHENDHIVILGANGSGKSTLLKILDGLYFPSSGNYWVEGKKISKDILEQEAWIYNFRRKVGFVFQDPDVQLFSPTVLDEVLFGPLHLGLSKERVIQRTNRALRMLGIENLKARAPYRLSSGEKKKVAIASVLSVNPRVWLFDEPTASLDPKGQSIFLDFINTLRCQNNTIITATHDLNIIEEIADRVIVLSEDHRIVWEGFPKDILADTSLLIKNNLAHIHKHRHIQKIHKYMHRHTHIHRFSHLHHHSFTK